MKRLCIFFFYDHQGIVDEYVDVLLNGLAGSIDRFIAVCNGKLTPEGRRIFRKYTDRVIVRENKGLDVWAYKTAIDDLGWDEICSFDEMIMMNHTICGPIFPFEDMFAEMDSRNVDFWGINMYFGGAKRPNNWPDNGYETIQDHLQSHFIAVRKHMLCSYEFQRYWRDMPPIESYGDSVGLHESVFTKKFSDMGFSYDCYISCDREGATTYPLMFDAHTLIREKKCPIVKRKRNVYQPFEIVINNDLNYGVGDMFKAIEECTDYDTDLIYKNTLRTSPLYAFQRCTLTDFISTEEGNASYKPIDKKKTAVILNVNNFEFFLMFKDKLNEMLSGFDVIVIAEKDIREYLSDEINISAGYELSSKGSFLNAMEENADRYEYFFTLSFDTLSKHIKSYDRSTLKMELDSLICSQGQMNYTAAAFENNKVLGLLAPQVLLAGPNVGNFNWYREQNAACVQKYAEYLDVIHSEDNHYHFPANNIFACRTDAVKGFSESLEKCFGSSHELPYDLLLPLYAQSKGFYTGRVMTEYGTRVYLSLLENMLYTKGELK